MPWPAALLDLARGLQWLFLEWPALTVTLQCARPLLYYDKLRGMMIVVPSLLAGVLLHFWLLTLCCCCVLPREKLLRFRCRTVTLYLVLVVLLYAPVSATILRFFTCRDIGGTSYLTAEPLVRCDSELHRAWAPTAWMGVVLWVAGLPCLAVLAIAKLAWQRRQARPVNAALRCECAARGSSGGRAATTRVAGPAPTEQPHLPSLTINSSTPPRCTTFPV